MGWATAELAVSPVDNLFSNDFVAETPGGAGPIEGVSTSNTAFVDVFRSGPVDTPVRITSFGDFERVFGGIDPRSEASYAIHQFFQNGGAVAWVVASPATERCRTAPT